MRIATSAPALLLVVGCTGAADGPQLVGDTTFHVFRAGSTNMTDVLLASMRRAAPRAEIGIFNAGSIQIDDVIPVGRLTEYDVIRLLPYGGPLMEINMRGDIVERALLAGTTLDYVELQPGVRSFIFLNPNDPGYVPPT